MNEHEKSMQSFSYSFSKGRLSINALIKGFDLLVRFNSYEKLLFRHSFSVDACIVLKDIESMNVGKSSSLEKDLASAEAHLWKQKFEESIVEKASIEHNNKCLMKELQLCQQELHSLKSTRVVVNQQEKQGNSICMEINSTLLESICQERSAFHRIVSDIPYSLEDHLTGKYIPRSVFEAKQHELNVAYLRLLNNRVKETFTSIRREKLQESCQSDNKMENRILLYNVANMGNINEYAQNLRNIAEGDKVLNHSLSEALNASEFANHQLFETIKRLHKTMSRTAQLTTSTNPLTDISHSSTALNVRVVAEEEQDNLLYELPQQRIHSNRCIICQQEPFGVMHTCSECNALVHIFCSSSEKIDFSKLPNFRCRKCSNSA